MWHEKCVTVSDKVQYQDVFVDEVYLVMIFLDQNQHFYFIFFETTTAARTLLHSLFG